MSLLYNEIRTLDETKNLTLVLATAWIINQAFAKYTGTTLVLGQYAISELNEQQHADIMVAVLKRTSTMQGAQMKFIIENRHAFRPIFAKFYTGLNEEHSNDHSFAKKDKAIWFVDSMKAFDLLEADLLHSRNDYHRNGYYCIIYTSNSKNWLLDIEVIFDRMLLMYVTNINILLMIGTTPYVYTYFPYEREKCQTATPKLLFSFGGKIRNGYEEYGAQQEKEFFPLKLANMQGCPLTFVCWTQPPMILVRNVPNGDEVTVGSNGAIARESTVGGIEGCILAVMSKRMNFKIYVINPGKEGRGRVLDNGTMTGALRMVDEGEANVTLGIYIYDQQRSGYFLPAYSYMNVPLLLAVPRGLPLTPYERLMKPFKYIIWSCLSASILFGILVIFCLRAYGNTRLNTFIIGSNNRIPFTNFWSSLYGGSIDSGLPKRNFARYVLAIWMIYTFILRNAYSGELFLILQDGRAKIVMKTINEVVAQKFTILMAPILEPIMLDLYSGVTIKYFDTSLTPLAQLLRQVQNRRLKYGLLTLGPSIRFFNRYNTSVDQQINILPQSVFTVPITMYMRKHSYIENYVNEVVLDVMTMGLFDMEESRYLDKMGGPKAAQEPIALSLWLLFGIFSVYLVLLLLSFCVFILELCSRRSRWLRVVLDFLNC